MYSLGTESRRPPAEYIPPQDTPYEFILFRAQEVKDLNVETQPLAAPQQRNVRDDPAIIGVSARHSVRVMHTFFWTSHTSCKAFLYGCILRFSLPVNACDGLLIVIFKGITGTSIAGIWYFPQSVSCENNITFASTNKGTRAGCRSCKLFPSEQATRTKWPPRTNSKCCAFRGCVSRKC